MKKQLVNFLKKFANELDPEAKDLATAVQSLIAETEQSEEILTADQLKERINTALAEFVATDTNLENKINIAVKKFHDMHNSIGTKSYIDSKTATRDFCNAVRASRTAEEFRANWSAKLTQNGITGLVFPTDVFAEIQNKWETSNGLFFAMRKVSNKAVKVPYTNDNGDATKARGHKAGATKSEQSFTTLYKSIDLQMIYKWLPLDRITLESMDDDDALIKWVIDELTENLLTTIERVVIAGEWRSANADKITSFESIGTKTTSDSFTTVVSAVEGDANALLNALSSASLSVVGNREKWLYVSRSAVSSLVSRVYASGGSPFFVGLDKLATELGVAKIVPVDYLDNEADAPVGVVITPDSYFRAGGDIFGEKWSIYEKNQEAFMAEVAAGGAIGRTLSTAVVRLASATA